MSDGKELTKEQVDFVQTYLSDHYHGYHELVFATWVTKRKSLKSKAGSQDRILALTKHRFLTFKWQTFSKGMARAGHVFDLREIKGNRETLSFEFRGQSSFQLHLSGKEAEIANIYRHSLCMLAHLFGYQFLNFGSILINVAVDGFAPMTNSTFLGLLPPDFQGLNPRDAFFRLMYAGKDYYGCDVSNMHWDTFVHERFQQNDHTLDIGGRPVPLTLFESEVAASDFLEMPELENADVRVIVKALGGDDWFKSLVMHNTMLGTDILQEMAPIMQFHTLEELILVNCHLEKKTLKAFCSILDNDLPLKLIDFSGNRLRDDDICPVLIEAIYPLENLKRVRLADCGLTGKLVRKLFTTMCDMHDKLQQEQYNRAVEAGDSGGDSLPTFHWTELTLDDNDFTRIGTEALTHWLVAVAPKSLETLGLAGTDVMLPLLLPALQSLKLPLKDLRLGRNRFRGVELSELVVMLNELPTVTDLSLDSLLKWPLSKEDGEGLPPAEHLQLESVCVALLCGERAECSLDLSHNDLTGRLARKFPSAVASSTCLQFLNLSYTNIGFASFNRLLDALLSNASLLHLRSLKLSGCLGVRKGVTVTVPPSDSTTTPDHDILAKIVKLLARQPHLRVLHIADNYCHSLLKLPVHYHRLVFRMRGDMGLLDLLEQSTPLTDLDICGNGIMDGYIEDLAKALTENETLRRLQCLERNPVSLPAVRALKHALHNNETLLDLGSVTLTKMQMSKLSDSERLAFFDLRKKIMCDLASQRAAAEISSHELETLYKYGAIVKRE